MSTQDTRSMLLRVLGEVAPDAELDDLRPDKPVQDQLDLDSMDMLNLMSGIYEVTGIEIPEADYGKLATLDGAVAYLTSSGSAQSN